jgi:methionyl-tRNA formyltransferase
LPSLEAVAAMSDVTMVAVVTQPAKPVGRSKTVRPTPVADWATDHHIPLLTPTSLRTSDVVDQLARLDADTFLVAAYGLILPQAVLDLPRHGCINIHASLLPAYRGASPIAAVITDGEKSTGISFMLMDAGIDTGPVLQQHGLPLFPDITTPVLENLLSDLAGQHISKLLTSWWDSTITPEPQSGPSSYAPILKTDDGHAMWDSAEVEERKIRAFQPWPGVWATWHDDRIKILSAAFDHARSDAKPGTIISWPTAPGWAIACRQGVLIPAHVQLAGKKPVAAKTMPGSYPDFIGSRLA